jgi:predicted ArsR family transcriptional regulator
MRTRIIHAITAKPMNAHQLAQQLRIDYKTVLHHLRVLVDNNVLSVIKKGSYGAVYFLAPEAERCLSELGISGA